MTEITRRDSDKSFSLPTDQQHRIVLKTFTGSVLDVEDVHFHFDSAVLMPDYGGDDTADKNKVTGLGALRAVYAQAETRLSQKILITGHTDRSGADAYNLKLSQQRADNVLHLLLGERDKWVAICDAKHQTEDIQQILKWVDATLGWGCDPGKVDNQAGPKTREATKAFQKRYNQEKKKSIAEDGAVGPQTWGAFFDVYAMVLSGLLETDETGLQSKQQSLSGRFVDGGKKAVGCGEHHPLTENTVANRRSQIDRRVEVLFFDPGEEPLLDCHPGAGKCSPGACEIYDPKMYQLGPLPVIPVPTPVGGNYDLTNVKAPERIASGKEKVKVEYDVVNEGNSSIGSGKVEILRKKDNKVLRKFDLKPALYTGGHHAEFEWDGAVDKNAEFPDGFATIEHSAYVVKVTVSGSRGAKSGTAEVKVELKDFKVELGKKEYLKDDDSGKRSKAVWDQVGAIPAASLVKLKLKSNLFAVTGTEMENQTAYTEYEKLWSGGPRIPLIATATVIDSTGKEVRAGMAMGRARVVWDYADPAQSIDTYKAVAFAPPVLDQAAGHASDSQGAKPYVDKARTHKKAGTVPKDGDNAHTDFSGKRTDNPGPPIYHAADGGTQNFPFACDKGATRKWAGLAPFVRTGEEEARAGAIFRPSRMAGDNYVLTAYLDLTAKLDVADDKPPSPDREVAIGSFEVWRQVNLVEHFRKNAQVTGVMPTFAEYFEDAYIEVKDERGGNIQDLAKAWYDTEMTAAIAAVTGYPLLKKYALKTSVSHWDGGTGSDTGWIAAFETYNDFKNKVKTGEGLSNAQLTTVLTNNGVETHFKYVQLTSYYAADFGERLCKKKVLKEGLTILQFDCSSSLEPSTWKILNGMAVFTERTKTGFLLTNTDAGTEQTPAHEIGHCMFLPHAPRADVDTGTGARTNVTSGGGITPAFHDAKNWNCLMSYNRPRPGFCGLCLLRLRGYNGAKFDKNGPK